MNTNKILLISCSPRLRMIGIAAIILLSFFQTLFGQSNIQLIGTISDDQSGEPIIGAEVILAGTPHQTFTDLQGLFQFENLIPGRYQIVVSSIGYQTKQLSNINVYSDQTFRVYILLTHSPVSGDSVLVEAFYKDGDNVGSAEKLILDSLELANYKNLGISQLLQQIPGLQIESTRGAGAGTLLRIHGGSSNQVLVLLDGQRLNNPQTGEVDLNMIPIASVEKIEVLRSGNTAQYGANAFDGVINFQTKAIRFGKSAQLRSNFGSFSTASGAANVRIGSSFLGVLLDYSQQYSKQNFLFPYNGEPTQRQNAWYKNYQIFGKTEANFDRHRLSLLYTYRSGDQGLPSAFYEQMKHFNAYSKGQNHAVQLNLRSFFQPNFYIQSMIGYHSLATLYNNEADSSPFTRYKSKQYNSVTELKIETVFMPSPSILARVGTQFLYEYLNGQDLLYAEQSIGKKNRQSTAVFGSMEWSIIQLRSIISHSQLRLALRYENALDAAEGVYPQIGISLVPRYLTFLSLSAGWGKSVRYPDFNSLFWKGDAQARGNPELSPERKIQRNVAANLSFPGSYLPTFNMYYYNEKITDLIFWHRTVNGLWQPRNEEKVNKNGWDVQLTQNIYKEYCTVNIAYSQIDAINKSEEPNRTNKRIVFIPQHSLNTSLILQVYRAQLTTVYRSVSERQTTAANTGVPLKSYQLFDLSMGYQFHLNPLLLDLGLVMKNLFSESYELIRGYPMPGREFQFSVVLKY